MLNWCEQFAQTTCQKIDSSAVIFWGPPSITFLFVNGFHPANIPVSRKFTLSISWKIFSNEGSKKYCPCLTISFRKESSFLFVFVLHVSFNINYVHGVLLAWSVFLRFHHLANFLFHPSHLQNLYFHLFHCYHKVNVEDKIMVDYVCSECLID